MNKFTPKILAVLTGGRIDAEKNTSKK